MSRQVLVRHDSRRKRTLLNKQDQILNELAKRKLQYFIRKTYPDYIFSPLHIKLCALLDRVVDGDITRLIISMPPQTGKSELCSVRLPAFWAGRNRGQSVILTSFGDNRALDNSMQARDICMSEPYAEIFPDSIPRKDAYAKSKWQLSDDKTVVYAAGILGSLTGFGGHLIVFDDPFKNWEEAQSQLIRDRVWNNYLAVARTRLRAGGRIIIMMTRWHEDDIVGRILKDVKQREKWHVARIPAIAETEEERENNRKYLGINETGDYLGRKPGESLDPKRWPLSALREVWEDLPEHMVSGMYQQIPRRISGGQIELSMFNFVQEPEKIKFVKKVWYWDLAATETGGCQTAGVRLGIDADENIYVIYVVRGHWGPDSRDKAMIAAYHVEKGSYIVEQEPGSSGVDAIRAIKRELKPIPIFSDRPTGSKIDRFMGFLAKLQAGKVYLFPGEWNTDYINQLLDFPNAALMDMTDATSGAYKYLSLSNRRIGFVKAGI